MLLQQIQDHQNTSEPSASLEISETLIGSILQVAVLSLLSLWTRAQAWKREFFNATTKWEDFITTSK